MTSLRIPGWVRGKRNVLETTQYTAGFHGGLRLAGNKISAQQVITDIPLPARLILPLLDYHKHQLEPKIRPGDYVACGDVLADGLLASSSGNVISIENHAVIHPSGNDAPCVVLETDGRDVYRADLPADNNISLEEQVVRSAIVGLGGAGFSTSLKLGSQQTDDLPLLIINGAECEPSISCDEALMHHSPDYIINGIELLIDITRAKRCVLAIEADKTLALDSMRAALKQRCNSFIELCELAPVYPTGAERPLVKAITGRSVPAGGLPADIGILCINVATAEAVYQAAQGKPLHSRIVTITGSLATNPCNARVRFGTPLSHVLKHTGNDKLPSHARLRAGGPLSGFDLPHASLPITATANCIMLEPQRKPQPSKACIRCGYCSDVCPEELLPQQLYWYTQAEDQQGTQRFDLERCIECGCCDLVCPSSIPLTQSFRYAKSRIRETQRQEQLAAMAEAHYRKREARLQKQVDAREKARKAKRQAPTDSIAKTLARARRKKASRANK